MCNRALIKILECVVFKHKPCIDRGCTFQRKQFIPRINPLNIEELRILYCDVHRIHRRKEVVITFQALDNSYTLECAVVDQEIICYPIFIIKRTFIFSAVSDNIHCIFNVNDTVEKSEINSFLSHGKEPIQVKKAIIQNKSFVFTIIHTE